VTHCSMDTEVNSRQIRRFPFGRSGFQTREAEPAALGFTLAVTTLAVTALPIAGPTADGEAPGWALRLG
jgi:hypothetical protein